MHVLGVDGGNTKTLALVARLDGTIVGAATGGCADIYNATSSDAALSEIETASLEAAADAGIGLQDIDGVVFSVAGADWPEDHALYRAELRRRLELATSPTVVNDAIGGLWAGSPDGIGVSVVCGTAGAVCGRGPDGRVWHASFWLGSSGGIALVRQALRATNRAALGIDPPTSLTDLLPRHFGEQSPETLLHQLTRRSGALAWREVARAAPTVLDAAHSGDATARRLVAECGSELGDFAVVAARRVGLLDDRPAFPLVLAGGVLRHPSPLLVDAIVARVTGSAPRARPVHADLPPAAGSVLLALDAVGIATNEIVERLRATLAELEPAALLAGSR